MRQSYIFTFTGKSIFLAVSVGAFFAILLISAGVLAGLYIYPAVSTSSPLKRISVATLTPMSLPVETKEIQNPDSALMYQINAIRISDSMFSRKPGARYYTIQLGLFAGRERSEFRQNELRQKGFETYVIPIEDKNKQWFAVRIGLFDNLKAARADILTIRKKTKIPTVLKQIE